LGENSQENHSMTQTLEEDVLEDIERTLSARGLRLSDCEIEILKNLRSEGVIFAEGVKFRITYKPTGQSAEYIEGHGYDIRNTLCKDIKSGRFP
jgi:hypothetical protein